MTDSPHFGRVLVFGNLGAGKSTLALALADHFGLAHLDLDTLAWEATSPPTRRSIDTSRDEIDAFRAAQLIGNIHANRPAV